jgi:Reverse transcriptase (RNA-dependent DNA polymerase)
MIFSSLFRKFVLVFFDDIVIYISNLIDHNKHVIVVLQRLKEHHLFAKESKCKFEMK